MSRQDPRLPVYRKDPKKLSAREQQIVIFFVRDCQTTSQVADALFISQKTVSSHLSNIYRKCEVHSLMELARWAHLNGLVNWFAPFAGGLEGTPLQNNEQSGYNPRV